MPPEHRDDVERERLTFVVQHGLDSRSTMCCAGWSAGTNGGVFEEGSCSVAERYSGTRL